LAISAHRRHLSAIPVHVALLSRSRVNLAISSHSPACFRNSSGACITNLHRHGTVPYTGITGKAGNCSFRFLEIRAAPEAHRELYDASHHFRSRPFSRKNIRRREQFSHLYTWTGGRSPKLPIAAASDNAPWHFHAGGRGWCFPSTTFPSRSGTIIRHPRLLPNSLNGHRRP
jgi:hypothetical protein